MTRRDHLLVILMEECAEVQYATSKALRFGLDDCPPGGGPTNQERMIRELVDLGAVIGMLEDEGVLVVDPPEASRWADEKEEKVEEFLRYSAERRRLSPLREGGGNGE